MKKFNLTTMLSLMAGIALADGGELVTTATTLENNKVGKLVVCDDEGTDVENVYKQLE